DSCGAMDLADPAEGLPAPPAQQRMTAELARGLVEQGAGEALAALAEKLPSACETLLLAMTQCARLWFSAVQRGAGSGLEPQRGVVPRLLQQIIGKGGLSSTRADVRQAAIPLAVALASGAPEPDAATVCSRVAAELVGRIARSDTQMEVRAAAVEAGGRLLASSAAHMAAAQVEALLVHALTVCLDPEPKVANSARGIIGSHLASLSAWQPELVVEHLFEASSDVEIAGALDDLVPAVTVLIEQQWLDLHAAEQRFPDLVKAGSRVRAMAYAANDRPRVEAASLLLRAAGGHVPLACVCEHFEALAGQPTKGACDVAPRACLLDALVVIVEIAA
ncbi:hypothetical protein CYMTET_53569, partial [Cymbomonas tetramitiformis]